MSDIRFKISGDTPIFYGEVITNTGVVVDKDFLIYLVILLC